MNARIRTRAISLLLVFVMVFSLLPAGVLAAPAEDRQALSGVGNLMDYRDHLQAGDPATGESAYDYVYYGGLKWRVLDTEANANSSQTGVLLLSENTLGTAPWNGYRMNSDRNGNGTSSGDTTMGYNASDVRAYLTGEGTYTAFQSGRSVNGGEAYYTIINYYYYRSQLSEDAIKAGPQAGTRYYVYANEAYKEETSDALNAGTFLEGQYFVQKDGKYERATEYDANTTYYYDASTYKEWTGSNFETGTDYFVFLKQTTPISRTISAAILGTLYYVGYRVNDTIVSGNSAAGKNLAEDYQFSKAEQAAVPKASKTA